MREVGVHLREVGKGIQVGHNAAAEQFLEVLGTRSIWSSRHRVRNLSNLITQALPMEPDSSQLPHESQMCELRSLTVTISGEIYRTSSMALLSAVRTSVSAGNSSRKS